MVAVAANVLNPPRVYRVRAPRLAAKERSMMADFAGLEEIVPTTGQVRDVMFRDLVGGILPFVQQPTREEIARP